jgi:hypothetical protein
VFPSSYLSTFCWFVTGSSCHTHEDSWILMKASPSVSELASRARPHLFCVLCYFGNSWHCAGKIYPRLEAPLFKIITLEESRKYCFNYQGKTWAVVNHWRSSTGVVLTRQPKSLGVLCFCTVEGGAGRKLIYSFISVFCGPAFSSDDFPSTRVLQC